LYVKANCKDLHDHLADTFVLERTKGFAGRPYDYAETVKKTRATSKSAVAGRSTTPTIAPLWIRARLV